jgi:serine/threonine protein kinase
MATPLRVPPEDLAEAAVGDMVADRYLLTREIARGGGGVVFQALHQFTKRPVALKLLLRQQQRSQEHRTRLLLEAEALTQARHRNVVEVLDAGMRTPGGPYLAMELLEGRAVDGILASRRRLSVPEAIWVCQQMAAAVARMHRLGLVHRDVKPSNAFLAHTEAGEEVVKLFDYGTVCWLNREADAPSNGELMGTPEYMAPEQLLGSTQPNPGVDVYALGVSLYECLSGEVPFEGTFGEVLLKVHQEPPPSLLARGVVLPKELDQIVGRCLAKEPSERFSDAGKLLDALSELALRLPTLEESLLGLRTSKAPGARGGEPQRRFVRAPYVTPVVTIQADGARREARSQDISEGGLLVLLPHDCQPELQVLAEFALPASGKVVKLPVKGRWVRNARVASAVGLEFTHLSDPDREDIHQYVTSLVQK